MKASQSCLLDESRVSARLCGQWSTRQIVSNGGAKGERNLTGSKVGLHGVMAEEMERK